MNVESLFPSHQICYIAFQWLIQRRSLIFTWEIRNAWQVSTAYEACLLYQKELAIDASQLLPITNWMKTDFLYSLTPSNLSYWRGLSGSDDFAWAAILNLECADLFQNESEQFIYLGKQWCGSRGALEFHNEIQSHYVDEDGSVWWDYKRTYKASISNSLFALLCLELYEKVGHQYFLESAEKTVEWLIKTSALYSRGSGVKDGVRKDGSIDPTRWTYNHAVILKALRKLFSITAQAWYIETAIDIVDYVLVHLVDNSNGLLCEKYFGTIRNQLSSDAISFKGIFIRYLADFIRNCTAFVEHEKLREYAFFIQRNASSVVEFSRNDTFKSFSPYWNEQNNDMKDNDEVVSLVAAFQLMVADLSLNYRTSLE